MNQGIFLNLFEVSLPSTSLSLMTKEWDKSNTSVAQLRQQLRPARLYASEEKNLLYAYGPALENATACGFQLGEFAIGDDPRFTGRLIVEAVIEYLVNTYGFELQHRLDTAKVYEVTDVTNPIKRVEGRVNVYPSYKIQPLFLRVVGELKFFLLIKPKARYRFHHPLTEIADRVDCTGRFVRVACPATCDVYDCPLYEHRGKLAGKLMGLTEQSTFRCRFTGITSDQKQFIQLDALSRFDFALPTDICELEASIPNIAAVFTQRFDQSQTLRIISELRIFSGDYLRGNRGALVNTEAGKTHWTNVTKLINQLQGGVPIPNDSTITISPEPVHTVAGGYMPEEFFWQEDTHIEGEYDDFDQAF